jgi:hypothetical protein
MSDQNQEAARAIFSAMLAAARGDDKVAGDLLRWVFGRISVPFGISFAPGEPGPRRVPVTRGAMPEQGEQESEAPEEEE